VVRPHPTESQEIYNDIAGRCERVKVTNAGNVVPWLLATKALIHNSCTTGVEASVMGVPAITYRASINETYDLGFYRLPNLISHPCFNSEELIASLKNILEGNFSPAGEDERKRLVEKYLAAREGPLACERIVDVLEKIVKNQGQSSIPGIGNRISGWSLFVLRTLIKRYKDSRPGSHNRPEFQSHRYPEISLSHMQERIHRFQQLLGSGNALKVELFLGQFFRISA
jgi:hypothetical protein